MLDFSFSDKLSDSIIVENDLEFVLHQIDLLFNTDVNEVLGDPTYGTNYDRYLYTLDLSNYAIEQKIQSDLQKLDLRGFSTHVSVHIVEGTIRDIAFIDITISGNYGELVKSYIIN